MNNHIPVYDLYQMVAKQERVYRYLKCRSNHSLSYQVILNDVCTYYKATM